MAPASQMISAARIHVVNPSTLRPPTRRLVMNSATNVEMIPTPPVNAEALRCTPLKISGARIAWIRAKMMATGM